MTVQDLPTLNASLNASAALFLIGGLVAIKKGKRELHIRMMMIALVLSGLFLTSYLYYHFHVPSKKFPDLGWIKTVYFLILFPHILMSAIMVPMIIKTLWHALRKEWVPHKRIARITFPVWMYVSVTGVIVYFMLYRWFE